MSGGGALTYFSLLGLNPHNGPLAAQRGFLNRAQHPCSNVCVQMLILPLQVALKRKPLPLRHLFLPLQSVLPLPV